METLARRFVPSQLSFSSYGAARLRPLATAMGFAGREEEVTQFLQSLIAPWGERLIGSSLGWPSDIGEDHTPYEFSLALGGGEPELRLLLEAQGQAPTLSSFWEAGRALNEVLARDFGADLSRLRQIESIFTPAEGDQAGFAIWHAACLWPSRAPELKIYLNPQLRGRAQAAARVEEALHILGCDRVWPALCEAAGRGPTLDEFKYFSLDLKAGARARVKVYLRHHAIDADGLERAMSVARSHQAGDARQLCREILGEEGPFLSKPLATCFALVEGDDTRPSAATLHLPVTHYAHHDQEVQARVSDYLRRHGLPVAQYEQALQAFAVRPLQDGVGLHSYASFRRDQEKPRLTVYFALEAYEVTPPGPPAQRQPAPPARDAARLVDHFEEASLVEHPFFQRLGREEVDLRRIAVLLENAREGLTRDFARRLARVVAVVPDERARSILAKQLNDELGDGHHERSHAVLFDQMIVNLAPWRPADLPASALDPGRALWADLEAIYYDPDPMVGIGAAIVLEVYGRQVDQRVGREVARQYALDPSSLTWLNLHQVLEEAHVDESRILAGIVPPEGLEAAWRGALAVERAATRFYDGLYRVCFLEAPLAPAR